MKRNREKAYAPKAVTKTTVADVIADILTEFINHLKYGFTGSLNKFLKFCIDALSGINFCVAKVSKGFNDAEIIQRIGNNAYITMRIAINE